MAKDLDEAKRQSTLGIQHGVLQVECHRQGQWEEGCEGSGEEDARHGSPRQVSESVRGLEVSTTHVRDLGQGHAAALHQPVQGSKDPRGLSQAQLGQEASEGSKREGRLSVPQCGLDVATWTEMRTTGMQGQS